MAVNTAKTQVKPFTINIPQAALDDLQDRLKRTRWPDEAPDSGWTMGTNLSYMKHLADYWQNKYDWRKHEAALNQFHHFTAEINGLNVHFIHERGKGPNPTPILLLHGWPDSFYRYHKLIPMLTDPARFGGDPNQSFDVVVPSLPGFGFSQKKALTYEANADLFATLMTDVLGYPKFISAGGDGGSVMSITLARNYPDRLRGIYLTDVGYPDYTTDFASLTPAGTGICWLHPAVVDARRCLQHGSIHQAPESSLQHERLPRRFGGMDTQLHDHEFNRRGDRAALWP